jgi:hypothetical protein
MQGVGMLYRVEFTGLDQPRLHHPHRMQRPVQILDPEIEEPAQFRKIRGQVVLLPDVALQEVLVVGHPVDDLCRGEPVALELKFQCASAYSSLHVGLESPL